MSKLLRSLSILICICAFGLSARAQFYSVNVDKKTAAAIGESFNAEAASEAYYDEQVREVLKHYKAAEVATAGIFASKFLDRKALTNLSIWNSSAENHYYRRIYRMTTRKIMPKIVTVARLMLERPHAALYWGSYLSQVCTDTKSLCMQFESLVTNSELSFKDVAFLEMTPEVAQIFRLSELGDVDWQGILDDFGSASANLSKEDLKADIDSLYRQGVQLATSGGASLTDSIMQRSLFNGLLNGKRENAVTIVRNYADLFDSFEHDAGDALLGMIGGKENWAKMFRRGDYNLTSWVSDYIKETEDTYYTQRWYIQRTDSVGSPASREEVYDAVFDSYSMDLNTFRTQLMVMRSEYASNDREHIYTVDADAKRYYQASNADNLKGCESVTISVTCSDDSELGKGTTQYKCGDCGKELNAHSKECAMLTTAAESSLDLSGLDEREREARKKIASLEAQISALQSENARIAYEISSASIEEAAELRNRYNANQTKIGQLQSELAQWQGTLEEVLAAKAEAANDNDVTTDDHYRIPAIMRDCQTVYDIRWQDKGAWNGFTFTRKGIVGGINGMVTFTARLTMARKPKYFLGIKIHRAILQIDWKLTAHYSTTNIVEVLTLDPAKIEQEKLDEVNGRISEIARQYPSCAVTAEYQYTAPPAEDDTKDTIHLLWASDRLEAARDIDTRITKIYADLVILEKMMHYRRSISDILRGFLTQLSTAEGRQDVAGKALQRWLDAAKNRNENE